MGAALALEFVIVEIKHLEFDTIPERLGNSTCVKKSDSEKFEAKQ